MVVDCGGLQLWFCGCFGLLISCYVGDCCFISGFGLVLLVFVLIVL